MKTDDELFNNLYALYYAEHIFKSQCKMFWHDLGEGRTPQELCAKLMELKTRYDQQVCDGQMSNLPSELELSLVFLRDAVRQGNVQ
jgi:hypothetical protein